MAGLLHYLLIGIAVLGSVAIYTAAQRLASPAPVDETDVALIAKSEVRMATAFDKLDPRRNLWDGVDLFILKTLRLGGPLDRLHMLLGRPEKPTVLDILHIKELSGGILAALLGYASHSAILAILGSAGGFFLPDYFLNRRIKDRQQKIMKQFPTFVDLAALTIEAGLDYMTAFERILKNASKQSELEVELGKMLNEISLGYSRKESLSHFAMRTGLQEIRSFVGLIVQSDELGTSLVDLLRNYAADMRFRRLNKAEKLAAQASTKMLFPLILFIFPTVFVMLMAPMVKSFLKGGLGF